MLAVGLCEDNEPQKRFLGDCIQKVWKTFPCLENFCSQTPTSNFTDITEDSQDFHK